MAGVFMSGALTMSFPMGLQVHTGSVPMIIVSALCIALLIPWIAVAWRRFHDIGWAGWSLLVWFAIFLFFARILGIVASDLAECMGSGENCFGYVAWGFGFTPMLAVIVLLAGLVFLMTRPSKPGSNKYGPNPQEVSQ